MKRIIFLCFLFFLLLYTPDFQAQENHKLSEATPPDQEKILKQSDKKSDPISSFHYDKMIDNFSTQLGGDYLLENLKRENWNESSSSWVNDSLYEHSYNNKNLVDTIIAHKWRNGSVWGNDGRWRYIYNANSKLIQRYNDQWATTYWQEYFKNDYYYSGPNQNLSQMSYYWYSDNTWVLYGYYHYSWNTNNYLTEMIHYVLSTIGPWIYIETWKDEYYYDSTNVLIMKTGFDYVGCYWVNDINDLYFYDNIGNQTENVRQKWNSSSSSWINDYRYLYEFDVNNILLSTLYQKWQLDSLNWKNVWRETYTYTPQNKIATMFKETWTPETGWNNYVFRTYYYDINYNWTEKLTQLWDGTIWKNYYRHLATWLEPVSVDEEQIKLNAYHLYNNFPNPFNPVTKIRFSIPKTEFVSLIVYDILGNEISSLIDDERPAGEYEVDFIASGLSSGIYFYQLKSGSFTDTKKMILLK
jgi:hypothetical protein